MSRILPAVAWSYTNGPRYIGHVAEFEVPSDVFSRYMRIAGHDVLMISGTDEHGTPILVAADSEDVSACELAGQNNRLTVEDLVVLGLSYNLFTRTTAGDHYTVVQGMFRTVRDNDYMVEQVTRATVSPSTGRALPDRYIEGTYPICGTEGARGDQCDACGSQLDPTEPIDPHSRISDETPEFVELTHYFLDLPALAGALSEWPDERENSGSRRPNVIRFSKNSLENIRPHAMTHGVDWGIPVPGQEDQPSKHLYVWFNAVIDYLSASIEWTRHSGDPGAWREWWNDPQVLSYCFMGKDNIVLHSQIWPAEMPGYNDQGAQGEKPSELGILNLPTGVVSSEFLTMEGKKFSPSHGIVIYVCDMLARYQTDAPRYFIPATGPEASDADFAWAEFLRRTSSELVTGWGNLMSRTASMTAKKFSEISAPGPLQDIDRALLNEVGTGFDTVGDLIRHHHQKIVLAETIRLVGETDEYVTETAPFKLKAPEECERLATVLYTLAQAVTSLNLILSPPLPHAANDIDTIMGGQGKIAPMPRIGEVEEFDPEVLPAAFEGRSGYPITTGDYTCAPTWERHEIEVGTPIAKPAPVFIKLDESIVEGELARYADLVPDDVTGARNPRTLARWTLA